MLDFDDGIVFEVPELDYKENMAIAEVQSNMLLYVDTEELEWTTKEYMKVYPAVCFLRHWLYRLNIRFSRQMTYRQAVRHVFYILLRKAVETYLRYDMSDTIFQQTVLLLYRMRKAHNQNWADNYFFDKGVLTYERYWRS